MRADRGLEVVALSHAAAWKWCKTSRTSTTSSLVLGGRGPRQFALSSLHLFLGNDRGTGMQCGAAAWSQEV